jgi:hypothetical protein
MAKRQRRRRQERRREHAKRAGWQTRHSVITGAGIAATATLGVAGTALADVQIFYVGSNADTTDSANCTDFDNTDCTLRDAVDAANANTGYSDYVIFTSNVSGTITLGSDINISEGVYIYGRGADVDAVSGDDTSRIFDIDLNTAGEIVRIYGLTLTQGYAAQGGAIRNYNSSLRLNGDNFVSNNADGFGGAILNVGEYADGVYDGVFYSTFSDNHAAQGGAVYAGASWGTLRSSTFSGNDALDGFGGAIKGASGYLLDSTVSGNSATASGGGVSVQTDEFVMYGTILANNTAGASDPDLYSPNGGTAGVDLVEDPGTSGIEAVPSVITGQDPQLGSLQNNGGYTPTLKPAVTSPVVDQSYSYSYYDQRFSLRIVDNPNVANVPGGNGADIGSVELTLGEGPQAPPSGPAPAPAPGPPFNLKKAIKKCKKKFPGKANAKRRKKCIKKAKRRAGASASPWRTASGRWSAGLPRAARAHHAFRSGR